VAPYVFRALSIVFVLVARLLVFVGFVGGGQTRTVVLQIVSGACRAQPPFVFCPTRLAPFRLHPWVYRTQMSASTLA
jgi:hypothetical protein